MRNLEEINESLQSKLADAYSELSEKNKRIVELEEQLAPYVEEEKERIAYQAKIQRYHDIVELTFPKYNWQIEISARPPRPPIKDCWSNGGKFKSVNHWLGSDLEILVSSYVGGGETQVFEFRIPDMKWLECEDSELKVIVQGWCIQERENILKEQKRVELARAEREAVDAVERLAKMKGEVR